MHTTGLKPAPPCASPFCEIQAFAKHSTNKNANQIKSLAVVPMNGENCRHANTDMNLATAVCFARQKRNYS
jgi:poly-beta-hydroxyalkanoate depolymerase